MVALGSLGTKLYFLNWLLAVAAIKFMAALTSPDSSATELSELWAILSHILAKVEKWRGHDCCYRRQFWVERVEKCGGKRSPRRSIITVTGGQLRGPLPHTWSLLSALCRAGAALQCWYDGSRRQDVRYELSLLPADSVRCGQDSHNNAVYRERATPYINRSPTPAVEH